MSNRCLCMCVLFALLMFAILSYLCRYVGSKLKENILRVGPESVYAVVFDGGTDFTATEPMIQEL